jgi:hypothetical protein
MLRILAGLIIVACAIPADAAPSRASSKIRSYQGRFETVVGGEDQLAVLDSLGALAERAGFLLKSRDENKLRLLYEKPATAEEVSAATGWTVGDTEVQRLQFEIIEGKNGRLEIVSATSLVQNPGTVGEQEKDVGKLQPWRNRMKALLERVKRAFPA